MIRLLHPNVTASGMDAIRLIQSALAAPGGVAPVRTGDYSGVEWPSNGGTLPTWDVYRLDDALQATKPVFFSTQWGTRNGYGQPQLTVTVGTGYDASSGAVTGQMDSVTPASINTGNDYWGRPGKKILGVGTEPWGAQILASGAAGNGDAFSVMIERARTPSGDLDPSGRVVLYGNTSYGTPYLRVLAHGIGALGDTGPAWFSPSRSRDLLTGATHHFPVLPSTPQGLLPPLMGATLFGGSDVSPGQTLTVTHYSGGHRYAVVTTEAYAGFGSVATYGLYDGAAQ